MRGRRSRPARLPEGPAAPEPVPAAEASSGLHHRPHLGEQVVLLAVVEGQQSGGVLGALIRDPLHDAVAVVLLADPRSARPRAQGAPGRTTRRWAARSGSPASCSWCRRRRLQVDRLGGVVRVRRAHLTPLCLDLRTISTAARQVLAAAGGRWRDLAALRELQVELVAHQLVVGPGQGGGSSLDRRRAVGLGHRQERPGADLQHLHGRAR